ncbi:hypothetical protein [Candidatus Venteria ishoeyi]|uniref:Uncharacterized protein n=1 Tax=Candidatus Venteria ishoeyi TaxID=1899563 RepID=A0A1H6F7D7_9GAMM|nr:hypothetical protein [Candidatus Venteria ishoeyi]SEH04865.1 Uncharacterised protein [Candidatus Venteria ishoeyi]
MKCNGIRELVASIPGFRKLHPGYLLLPDNQRVEIFIGYNAKHQGQPVQVVGVSVVISLIN